MGFGHERLDVYRAAIHYVGWAHRFLEGLKGHRKAMLTKLGQRGYAIREVGGGYLMSPKGADSDSDSDSDPEGSTRSGS